MKIKKDITLTICISQRRQPGPLQSDEIVQLTSFFVALMDLAPQEDIKVWERDDRNNYKN